MKTVNTLVNWQPVALGELIEIVMGQAPPGSECNKDGRGTIFVKAGEFAAQRPVVREWTTQPLKLAEHGDVFICVVGATSGKINLGIDCAIGRSVAALRPTAALDQKYLYYFLTTKVLSLRGDSTGSAQGVISKDDLSQIEIPTAPINEQRRIVAKIEELFSELDKGIENLKTARAQLKVYRQALLKHAFEGKLTAQWRAENQDKLETAAALQKRIQQERAQRYQQQLAEWTNKSPSVPLLQRGKPTSAATSSPLSSSLAHPPLKKGGRGDLKPKSPKPLPPLTKEELAELPELPEGWAWTRLGNTNVEISDGPFGSNLKSSDYVDSGVRVVRLENIGSLKFIEDKESFVTEEKYELLKRHSVTTGDIVFSSFIIENVRVALVPPSITKAINKADCFCVRFSGETLSNIFAVLFLSTRHVYKQLESLIHGVGRPRINTTQLKDVVIPVCSAAEQQVIIAEIESRLSEVDQLELTLTTSLQQAEALRQSILKKAFAGLLVPQDPHDEPASKLLARIKAERATVVKSATVRQKGKRG